MFQKISKNLIVIAIIITGALIAGTIFYVHKERKEQIMNNQTTEEKTAGILTGQQAAEKVINFINQNLVEPGMTVSLLNVAEERGLYKISFKAGEEKYDSYVTKDGKLLFFQGIDMEKVVSETQTTEEKTEEQQTTDTQATEEEEKFSEEQLENLAKCLKEKGAKFYGAYWCGWCKKQKEIFGKAAQYLPYIECVDEKTKQTTSQCQEADIQGYPTWEFNGKKNSGFKTINELSKLSECPL